MDLIDKVKFVELMLQERYLESNVIELRRCHLWSAKCSMKFRNLDGIYYWHYDNDRLIEPKRILII